MVACSTGDTMAPSSTTAMIATEKCTDVGTWAAKDEIGPPWSLTAPANKAVKSVCVKAGTKIYARTTNGTISVNGTPCFVVSGLGTPTVTAANAPGHVGNICKGISHIEVKFGPAPSPSPSPSPSPPLHRARAPRPTELDSAVSGERHRGDASR